MRAVFLIVSAGLLTGAASSQDLTAAEQAQIAKDLDHVFARPPGPVNRDQSKQRFKEFFAKYRGRELGRFSYAHGLFHYWNRDMDQATTALDTYLAKHDPQQIAAREQRMMIGRTYLSAAVRAGRDGKVSDDRFVDLARKFARCYDDVQSVGHYVTRGLGKDQAGLAARARVAMVEEVVAKKLPAASTDAMIKAIYGERAGGGARAGGRAGARPPRARPKMPTTLQPFTATAMSGKVIDLKSYRGQVVMVDFWATWCGPCIRELPNVVKAHQKYRAQGFEVIGISLDKKDAEPKIKAMATRLGMTWEQIYDGGFWSAKLAKQNGIRSIPAAFLIDRAGKVRFSGGEARGDKLAPNIEKLLAEKITR